MANLSIKEMINAGVHFGHQSKYWNPKMRPYIYTTYKKLHIINLEQSLTHFNAAIAFVEKLTKNNAKILFVGTKRAARELIVKHAVEAKMPYVNNRWLGGMLTNFDTIKKSIAKLDVLKGQLDLATLNGLTKKESLNIKKQNIKKKFSSSKRDIDEKQITNFNKIITYDLQLGDVLLMNLDIVHRSGNNVSSQFRFSLLGRFHNMIKEDFNSGLSIYRYSNKKLEKEIHG